MLVRNIELNNFLGHEKESISLPEEGLFLLSGESGFGKSSLIVDAVAYCLFGTAATRAKKQADLVNKNHLDQPMSVRVMFDLGGELLIVARGVQDGTGKGGWAKVYQPDPANPAQSNLLAEGAQPVQKILRRKIGGMSWQQFYAAFVARQSEISLLTTLRGAERKNLIHRMLGMRELEKSSDLISSGLRRTKAEIDQLERSIGSVNLKERNQTQEILKEEIEKEKTRLKETNQDLEASTEKLLQIKNQLQPIREANQAQIKLESLREKEQNLLEKKSRHDQAQKELASLDEKKKEAARLSDQTNELREIFTRSRQARKEEDKISQKEKEIILLRKELSDQLGQEVVDAKTLFVKQQTLQHQLRDLKAQKEDLDQQRERLSEGDQGECFACLRPFETEAEHDQALHQIKEKALNASESLHKTEAELVLISDSSSQLKDLEAAERDIEGSRERLNELKSEGELSEDLESLEEEGKRLAAAEKKTSSAIQQAEFLRNDLDGDLEKQIGILQKEKKELEDIIAQVSVSENTNEQKLEHLEQELKELEERTAILKGSVPEINKSISRLQTEWEASKKLLEGLEHEINSLEKLQHRAITHERLQTMLRSYQQKLAGEIRPSLEDIASEMMQKITGGRHKGLKISEENYDVEIISQDGYVLPASMVSGGEEIRANLCLRLALTRLVSQRTGVPVGFLVLDEPLPAQDPGHIERILELLESLRPFYKQQFIISHVGNLDSADEIDHILEFTADQGKHKVKLIAA